LSLHDALPIFIIVARGGGDFQNLLVFSDEALVRAVAEAVTPLVSAIGHEADRPLLDEVADLRASTPTDAAKRVVPDVAEELTNVRQARARIGTRMVSLVSTEIDRLEQLRTRPVLAGSDWLVDSRAEELSRYVGRSRELIDLRLERSASRVTDLKSQLRALSPQGTLNRGYSIAQLPDGSVLRSEADAPTGTRLLLTLADGSVHSTVEAPPASA